MSDKADVAVSYDVDNEFFRLWLDERMNYTCAVFEDTDDLETAQLAKLDVLYRFGKVDAGPRGARHRLRLGREPRVPGGRPRRRARCTASPCPRRSTRRSAGGACPG